MHEFFKLNLPVAVLVHLLYNLVDLLFRHAGLSAQHLLDFFRGNRTVAVFIEKFERLLQLFIRDHGFLIHRRHDELGVVDRTVAVDVDFSKNFVDFLFGNRYSGRVLVAFEDFFLRKLPVAILVNLLKNLLQIFSFLLGCQL